METALGKGRAGSCVVEKRYKSDASQQASGRACTQNTRARPRNKPLGGLALVFCIQNTRERPLKRLALVFCTQNTRAPKAISMEKALGKEALKAI